MTRGSHVRKVPQIYLLSMLFICQQNLSPWC